MLVLRHSEAISRVIVQYFIIQDDDEKKTKERYKKQKHDTN